MMFVRLRKPLLLFLNPPSLYHSTFILSILSISLPPSLLYHTFCLLKFCSIYNKNTRALKLQYQNQTMVGNVFSSLHTRSYSRRILPLSSSFDESILFLLITDKLIISQEEKKSNWFFCSSCGWDFSLLNFLLEFREGVIRANYKSI